MDISVILAIITIIGNIVLALFQLRVNRAIAKEKEASTASILIDRAMEVSKKEVEHLKEVIDLLEKENQELREKIKILECKTKKEE